MTIAIRSVLATPQETRDLGRRVGAAAEAGALILLVGEVGAGKTTFAQGVAAGLGVAERVTSPTFVLAREHSLGASESGPRGLVHVDLYRADTATDFEALALGEYLDDGWVVLVEWADRAQALDGVAALRISLAVDGAGRRADIAGRGDWAEAVVAAL